MLTKEELKGTYIRYTPEITKEIFDKIVKRLTELGITNIENIEKEYNFFINRFSHLAINSSMRWQCKESIAGLEYKEIKVSDILGEDKKRIEYVVVTSEKRNYEGNKNFCYKLGNFTGKENCWYIVNHPLHYALNLNEIGTREATKEEIEEYERRGESYDVTTLSKPIELVKGEWYEIKSEGDKWIFKFKEFKAPNEIWNTNASTPHDGYTNKTNGYLAGKPEDCKPANMEEVYRLFPEERKNIISIELSTFPEEGSCLYNKELVKFLKKKLGYKPDKYKDQKLVAWNTTSLWYCTSSGKKEYTIEQLSKFIDMKKELTKDVLQDNVIYYASSEKGTEQYIFELPLKKYICVHRLFWSFAFSVNPYYKYRKANEEEVKWFNACKKADKFIPKSEALSMDNEWWKSLKKGDYVVTTRDSSGGYPINYIFEIDILSGSIIYTKLDNLGSTTNGWGKGNFRKAAPEEIKMYEHAGKPVDVTTYKIPKDVEFILPEKWCIKSDGNGPVGRYFDFQYKGSCYIHFKDGFLHRFNGKGEDITKESKYKISASFHNHEVREGYKEITFEQFKKYILKEKGEEMKEEPKKLPTDEELLEEAKRKYPIGAKFYPIHEDGKCSDIEYTQKEECHIYKSGNKTWIIGSANIYNGNGDWAKIISTPKEIEKWSVGSYVVALKDEAVGIGPFKKGDIAIIRGESTIDLVKDDSRGWRCSIYHEKDGLVKWFPTKEEAEKFAAELKGEKKVDETTYVGKIISEFIFRELPNGTIPALDFKDGHFDIDGKVKKTGFSNIREATKEESQWLEACITAGKFIEKDYALRGYDMYGKPISSPKEQQKQTDMKFEVGKWYKNPKEWSSVYDYIKCSDPDITEAGSIRGDEIIYYGKWSKAPNTTWRMGKTVIEATLEEIQQYLPESHPDRIKVPKDSEYNVGDWVLLSNDANGWGSAKHINNKVVEIKEFKTESVEKIIFTLNGMREKTAVSEIVRKATPEEIQKVTGMKSKDYSDYVGKWLIYTANPAFMCYIESENCRYGFNLNGNWFHSKDKLIDPWNGYREASESEVKEKLLSYAKKKYPVGTEYKSATLGHDCIMGSDFNIKRYSKGEYFVFNGGNSVFDGDKLKWAEIISSPKEQGIDLGWESVGVSVHRNYWEIPEKEGSDNVVSDTLSTVKKVEVKLLPVKKIKI